MKTVLKLAGLVVLYPLSKPCDEMYWVTHRMRYKARSTLGVHSPA